MRNRGFFLPSFLSVGISPGIPATGGEFRAVMAERLERAFRGRQPYPLASRGIEGLNVELAYGIQEEIAGKREEQGDEVAGYKAGLTAPEIQAKFGLDHAVRGTLFRSMLQGPGTLHVADFGRMFIETEIGFRLRRDLITPVDDSHTLRDAVDAVFPAIELPDVNFEDTEQVRGTDLIAANVAARRVLTGEDAGADDLNAVSVRLFHEGMEKTRGVGKNALGDQWEALRWTVNDVLTRGGRVRKGYIMITGAISAMIPAERGEYLADYGDFGRIEFEYR